MNGLVRDIHTVSFLNQNVLCQACRVRIERIEPEEHMEQENPCSPHIILCRNKMIFEHLRSNISLAMIKNKVTNTLLPVTDLHRTEELSVMQDEQMERPKSANIAYGVTTILEQLYIEMLVLFLRRSSRIFLVFEQQNITRLDISMNNLEGMKIIQSIQNLLFLIEI